MPINDDPIVDIFTRGNRAALEIFRDELLHYRDEIERDGRPPFDVIVELLEQTIDRIPQGDR